MIQAYGREADEVVLIDHGLVSMYYKNGISPFMLLPVDSMFNEYTLLFKVKSNIEYKAF